MLHNFRHSSSEPVPDARHAKGNEPISLLAPVTRTMGRSRIPPISTCASGEVRAIDGLSRTKGEHFDRQCEFVLVKIARWSRVAASKVGCEPCLPAGYAPSWGNERVEEV